MFEYTWHFSESGSAICSLSYWASDASVGLGSDCSLEKCMVGETDIYPILNPKQVRMIENAALIEEEKRIFKRRYYGEEL